MHGARITDAVKYFGRKGNARGAVGVIRQRRPDKYRWKRAVSVLNRAAAPLEGIRRARIEEPVREVVVELPDVELQQEIVLDARRFNVDLDRGELLPHFVMGDLRRFAYLVGVDVDVIDRYVEIPEGFFAPIDTAGCALVARAMSNKHKKAAERLWLELPHEETRALRTPSQDLMAEQAQGQVEKSRRWDALAATLLGRPVTSE